MKRITLIITGIITSLYFFPVEFSFFSGVNTKMMLAIVGAAFLLMDSLNRHKVLMYKEIFAATVFAALFSLMCYYSVVYNNTNDYAYSTYIVSMAVWMGGAFAVCRIIQMVHGYISLKLVINYLVWVCAVQCILALLIDNFPSFKFFVDTHISSTVADTENMNKLNRLYGIGAALDVAGTRFAAVLTMIAVLIGTDKEIKNDKKQIALYVFLFVLIALIGAMIARTTTIGMFMALVYILYSTGLIRIKRSNQKLFRVFMSVLLLSLVVCVFLYNYVPAARTLFRFAFESFFNWLETGEWKSNSTEMLQGMWILPESIKTWIVGDGYFASPSGSGFYMGIDAGYLRFIYYCGLLGLSMFSLFFVYLSIACYQKFPNQKHIFFFLFVLVFVIWVKVSTDIFLIYALFLCIPDEQKQKNFLMQKL